VIDWFLAVLFSFAGFLIVPVIFILVPNCFYELSVLNFDILSFEWMINIKPSTTNRQNNKKLYKLS